MNHPIQTTLLIVCGLYVCTAFGQTPPDSGRILQQERMAPPPPIPSPTLEILSPGFKAVQPGGAKVRVKEVKFTGNSVYSSAQLAAVLGRVGGQALDLAGLQALARKVTVFYREHGYPFATAYLPAQKLVHGVLRIRILEGRYGQVKAEGGTGVANHAQRFLSHLKSGGVIKMAPLQRSLLLLDDLPGIHTRPVIRPGQEVGTGDLIVHVTREPSFTGEIGGDNHGDRFTGEYRVRAGLQWNSPFSFGDRITLNGFLSNERQWLGDFRYDMPLGNSGLRGRFGYAHTRYHLGKGFKPLDANGTVDQVTIGGSYPVIRSQHRNLTIDGAWQHKWLKDNQSATNTRNNKRSDILPLSLHFDLRDGMLGGGLNYGSLSLAAGNLKLGVPLEAIDASTARTAGHFHKWDLDLVRVQSTPFSKLRLYGRFSGQWASKNLDSSEEFGLGGPYGVRAYPVGEGFGDAGWLAQVEVRYRVGHAAPYGFYDAGRVKINERPWKSGRNHRSIAGAGIGLRYSRLSFDVDASLAWRTRGGRPLSDTKNRKPRGWVTAAWHF